MNITKDQFLLQLDRLIDTFGDKFPPQREQMFWESCVGYEYDVVIAVVDSFIRSGKFAPLPQDFHSKMLEIGKPSVKKYALGEIQPKEIAKCWDCGDSGFIRLQRKETFDAWAKFETGSAPCHCYRGGMAIEAARRRPNPQDRVELGPQFSDTWRRSYKILPEYHLDNTVV